jgi:glycosyltransferase involved in cell wall biosynthesis
MRPRILHLIDTGGPGGAETIYTDVVTGLAARGWSSVAAVPVRDWLYSTLEDRGIQPVLLETHGSFDIRYVRRIRALIRREHIHIVHAHLLASSVYGSLAGRLTRIPVVCTFHGEVDVAANERFRAAKFAIIDRRRNHVAFVSDALRRTFLARNPLKHAATSVVHNGIDLDAFRPGPEQSGEVTGSDMTLLGAVGNVRTSKAYDVLLRTMALLRERGRPCRLVIIGQTAGGGELFAELCALRAALHIEDIVEFAGFREDIPRLLRSFDIYVSSSRAEGFSLTTVQAMASGVPVVATRCGGPEEIVVNDATGVLVPIDNPGALADAIESLIADPQRRRTMATAARASVEKRFSRDTMVEAYARIYEQCTGMAPASDPS